MSIGHWWSTHAESVDSLEILKRIEVWPESWASNFPPLANKTRSPTFHQCLPMSASLSVAASQFTEGSLEVKLPTISTDEKQRWEESEKRRVREEKRREEKRRRKKLKRESLRRKKTGARKGRKVAKHCVFPMILWLRKVESRLAKAAGAEPAGQMRDEKLHAVVARSTFPSQNVQNTSCSDHFWKLRYRISARRCGAKHISKSKC